MDTAERMMSERMDRTTIAHLLAIIAPLFARLGEERYAEVFSSADWKQLCAVAAREAHTDEERARWARALAPLGSQECETLRDELLVPGLPYALVPVESLYKPWSAQKGNAFGAARGLYLGDAARHLSDVYRRLSIDVPEAFASMPDHLTLELELLSLVLEAGNAAAARQLVQDHFDWLGSYDEALERHAAAIAETQGLLAQRRANLLRSIGFVRALLALTDRIIRAIV